MTSQFVTIKGDDLEYFRGVIENGLSGSYGELSEVRIAVSDRGLTIGANNYSSQFVGEVDSAVDEGEKATETVSFTTIPQGPAMKKKHRIALLERQVAELQQFAAKARQYIPD